MIFLIFVAFITDIEYKVKYLIQEGHFSKSVYFSFLRRNTYVKKFFLSQLSFHFLSKQKEF